MRENPWHLRIPTAANEQWYKNLSRMDELIRHWAEALNRTPMANSTPPLLANLLDETSPEDSLGRLESSTWKSQATFLSECFKDQPSEKVIQLKKDLEHASWTAGNSTARTLWPKLTSRSSREPLSLEQVFLAFQDTPFSGSPRFQGFLLRRRCLSELQLELRHCPHRQKSPEILAVADSLCRLHGQWLHGYASALAPCIKLEHLIQSPRCVQKWALE